MRILIVGLAVLNVALWVYFSLPSTAIVGRGDDCTSTTETHYKYELDKQSSAPAAGLIDPAVDEKTTTLTCGKVEPFGLVLVCAAVAFAISLVPEIVVIGGRVSVDTPLGKVTAGAEEAKESVKAVYGMSSDAAAALADMDEGSNVDEEAARPEARNPN